MGVFSHQAPTTRPRTGRLLPGPAQRPAGHHRHLLDRAGPGARRHPVPPVRRPRRPRSPTCSTCAAAMAYKNAHRRARPRRRQGGHLGRPGHGSRARRCCARTAGSWSRSAAATTPPATSAPTPRTWTWWPGRPGSSPAAASSNGGCGDSSVLTAFGRLPGHAGRGRAPVGHARRSPGAGSASPASARSASTSTGHLLDDGAAVVVTDVNEAARRLRSARSYPQVDVVADTAALITSDIDVYAPVRPRRRARRRHRAGAAGQDRGRRRQQPARPPRRREAARGPRHPLRAGLRGQRRRRDPGRRRDPRLQLRPGQGPRGQDLRHHPADPRSSPTPRACRPAVAADRLAERRMAEVGPAPLASASTPAVMAAAVPRA